MRSYLSLEKEYKKALSIIHVLYRLVNTYSSLRELMKRLCKLILQATHSQYISITLFEVSGSTCLRARLQKNSQPQIENISKRRLTKLELRSFKTEKIIRFKDQTCLPLISDKMIGTFRIKRAFGKKHLTDIEEELLKIISEQITVGIKTCLIYQEEHRLLMGVIRIISSLLEERFPKMHRHRELFSYFIRSISKELNLPPKRIEILELAGLLHDAGKFKIPTEILSKTTPLSVQEQKILRRHPFLGAQLVKHLQLLKPTIPIILHHHERYDGSGYPSGLKKGQIPLESRIMAVVDAFDAMISGRPYKKKKTVEEAIEELRKNQGTQFDPAIVDIFIKILRREKTKKLLQKYKIEYNN